MVGFSGKQLRYRSHMGIPATSPTVGLCFYHSEDPKALWSTHTRNEVLSPSAITQGAPVRPIANGVMSVLGALCQKLGQRTNNLLLVMS